jgi:hypothetical protein
VKKKINTPTAASFPLFRQLCNFIPNHLVPGLARKHASSDRTYSAWSHVVSLLYLHFTHALSLNDVCDGLKIHRGPLSAVRGATPPSKNAFSHANRTRNPALMEELFWQVMEHLKSISPAFLGSRRGKRLAHRFKRTVHVLDATVIKLVMNCFDWAKHRRRKAAAKCHLRLDMQSFLPRFAVIDTGNQHDSQRAAELCAGVKAGEIVVFDRAYMDFTLLNTLDQRGIFWVVREREDQAYQVVKTFPVKAGGSILRDEIIMLTGPKSSRFFPMPLRRVVALVEANGQKQEMGFLSNNLTWAASSVAELYRCRWQIEILFKQLKQTLQLSDFVGHNARAVQWQVWSALLVYVLLRYAAFLSEWNHSFSRLWCVVRSALWKRAPLRQFLEGFGTAEGSIRFLGAPEQAYFIGLA